MSLLAVKVYKVKAYDLWSERDLYHDIPVMELDLKSPFRYWGPILTQVLMGRKNIWQYDLKTLNIESEHKAEVLHALH